MAHSEQSGNPCLNTKISNIASDWFLYVTEIGWKLESCQKPSFFVFIELV